MKNNLNIVKHISEIINNYELNASPEYSILVNENRSLRIFICGKSGSGKTTFLNALLGLKRNELYTSTKISTMTRFNLIFGDSYSYQINGELEIKKLPFESKERQEVFEKLNELDKVINIYIPNDIIKNIELIDIPGFFDHKNKNVFKENAFYEADLIVFLKKYSSKLSPEEKEFIDELNKIGIKFIILFTFMDFYDPNEGIPEDEFPIYLKEKAKDYSNNAIYFPISSELHFSNPEISGIEEVKNYFHENQEKLKNNSVLNQFKRVLNYYINELQEKQTMFLSEIKEEIDQKKEEVDNEIFRLKLKNEESKEILRSSLDSNIDDLIQFIQKFIENSKLSKDEKKAALESLWIKEWDVIINTIINNKELEFVSSYTLNVPELPLYDDIILENNYDYLEALSLIRDTVKFLEESDGSMKNSKEKVVFQLFMNIKKSLKNSKFPKEAELTKLLDLITGNKNFPGLKKILEFFKYKKEKNIFVENIEKISLVFSKDVMKNIPLDHNFDKKKNELESNIKKEESELICNYKIKEMEDDIVKLKDSLHNELL